MTKATSRARTTATPVMIASRLASEAIWAASCTAFSARSDSMVRYRSKRAVVCAHHASGVRPWAARVCGVLDGLTIRPIACWPEGGAT